MMKAVQDVESVPIGRARKPPSPKHKDKGPPITPFADKKNTKNTKKTKTKPKKATDSVIFGVIGNPKKMSEKPKPDVKKKKKKSKYYDSSDGSLTSLSSLGGGSIDSTDSGEFSDDNSYDSEMSGSSFDDRDGNRRGATMRRRKDEIMQEKIEMLTRISNMSRMGFTASKKWSMKDDVEEIRFECYRMTREKNSKFAVKYMQQMLITVASIIEFASGLNNPFNMKLQGFSKNLMLTVSADYDNQLEELHHKWSGRTSLGPEMQILLTFVTSAIYHHAGNSMGSQHEQQTSREAKPTPAAAGGPSMSSVLGLFSNMMPKTPASSKPVRPRESSGQSTGQSESTEHTEPKKRRPMRGPEPDNVEPSMKVPE